MTLGLKTKTSIQSKLKENQIGSPMNYLYTSPRCRGCESDSGLYDDVSGLAEVDEAIEEEAGLSEESTLLAESQAER